MADSSTNGYKRGPYKKKAREAGGMVENESRTGYPELGDRLKNRLVELNLTQEELAEAIGMSKGSVSAYINGTQLPPTSCLPALSRFLGLSIDYLLGLNTQSRVDESYKTACKLTGLSEKAVDNLRILCKDPGIAKYSLNRLLESDTVLSMMNDLEFVLRWSEALRDAEAQLEAETGETADPADHSREGEYARTRDMLRLSLFEFSESAVNAAKTIFRTDALIEKANRRLQPENNT